MSGSSHGDRLRGIIARAHELGDVAEMDDAAAELDALLAENQRLRDALRYIAGFDVAGYDAHLTATVVAIRALAAALDGTPSAAE